MTAATRLRVGTRAFAPTQLSGLHTWLAADAITGLVNGAAVATWLDASGNGHDAAQATAGNRPLYRTGIWAGRPVIRFDGNNDSLATANFGSALPQPATVALAAKTNAVGWQAFYDGKSVNNRFAFFHDGDSGGLWLLATSAALFGGASNANPHIFTAVFDGASSALLIDGAGALAGDTGNHSLGGLSIGLAADNSIPLNGDIAELLIYNRLLTTTERQALERHLGAKYAIAVA